MIWIVQTQRYVPETQLQQVFHSVLVAESLAEAAQQAVENLWRQWCEVESEFQDDFGTVRRDQQKVILDKMDQPETLKITRITPIEQVQDVLQAFDDIDWHPWEEE